MRIAYVDCFSGLSGDMFLGALLDAGLPMTHLQRGLKGLRLSGWRLAAKRVQKGAVRCTRLEVHTGHHDHHHHRPVKEIFKMLERSDLSTRVKGDAMAIFTRLAEVEGNVHNVPPGEVEFHEVGSVDSIVDVVGACLGLEIMDVDKLHCSRIPVSHGVIHGAHGVLPNPGPAAMALLKGFPLVPADVDRELLTPTGAAILATLVEQPGVFPAMTLEAVGYGAGHADLPQRPNFARVLIGEAVRKGSSDVAWLIETNLDDTSGQRIGYAMEQLFAAGALDVWTSPITMKKSRPGVKFSVLADPEHVADLEAIILRETAAFGVRRSLMERTKLDREVVKAKTRYGEIRVKIGRLNGSVVQVSPEYDDVRAAAASKNVPFQAVSDEAVRAVDLPRGRKR